MGILGNGWDDPQSAGNMALAAGLVRGDFAGALSGYGTAMQQSRQEQLKNMLVQAQLANYASEIDARKLATIKDQREQEMIARFLPVIMGGGTSAGGQGAAGGGQGASAAPVSFGAFTPGADGMGPVMPSSDGLPAPSASPSQSSGILGPYGVPPQALAAEMIFNKGKGIGDMLYKRGVPDMQVSNGFAYDKNSLPPGFVPQINISQNGQASMVLPGANGVPMVMAPPGAMDTYAGYRAADERTKANLDTMKVYNNGKNQEEFRTRSQVADAAAGAGAGAGAPNGSMPAPDAGVTGNFSGDPAQIVAAIQGIKDPQERANAMAAFNEQARRTPGFDQGGAFAAGPSASQAAAARAAEVRAAESAKADVARDTTNQAEAKRFNQMQATASRAIELLQAGPTGSGAGRAVDETLAWFGKSTKGAELSQQLKVLGGYLTSNVPRMEGPQSDRDVVQYQQMAGMVGDETLPVSRRLAAAREVQSLQQKYASLNGWKQQGGATGDFGSGQPQAPAVELVPELPKSPPTGTRARDHSTGKTLRFNGMQWVPE